MPEIPSNVNKVNVYVNNRAVYKITILTVFGHNIPAVDSMYVVDSS